MFAMPRANYSLGNICFSRPWADQRKVSHERVAHADHQKFASRSGKTEIGG